MPLSSPHTPVTQIGDAVRVFNADARSVASLLEPNSIDMVLTSPPYYSLRDYGTGEWVGGSNADCEHLSARKKTRYDYDVSRSPIHSGNGRGPQYAGTDGVAGMWSKECSDCGASRVDLQIGLEDTLGDYVRELVGLFSEIKTVLKPEGTVWLNLGDTYRDKQLLGVPWKVAFALQDDGWFLRSDIIWAKPNPIPESCRDRPTRSHEHLFLLAQQPSYFCNMDAIREEAKWERWGDQTNVKYDGMIDMAASKFQPRSKEYLQALAERGRNSLDVWSMKTEPVEDAHFACMPEKLAERCVMAGCPEGGVVLDPFFGAGTTGLVARDLRRTCVGIELNPEYIETAQKRFGRWTKRNLERQLGTLWEV